MRIERIAVSTFLLKSESGQLFLIDPWISGNPTATRELLKTDYLKQFDAAFISHGHLDHATGIPDFAQANPKAPIICTNELGNVLIKQGITNVIKMDFGGSLPIRNITVSLVTAAHSSSYGKDRLFCGPPAGIVITLENGFRIYYAGDTGLTSDMKFVVGEYFKPDLAILPVGGVLTMDVEQAAYAAGEFIKAPRVIPCHYFPTPEIAPDREGMAEFHKRMPLITPMMGDLGNKFKDIVKKRYPWIEAIVLELGEGFTL